MMKKQIITLSSFFTLAFTAQAQDFNYGETPQDSAECVKNYSLYTEYYKQKNYASVLEPLNNTIKYCPKLSKSVYQQGAKAYQALIKEEQDEAKKAILEEQLLALYDLRIKHFGEEGFVLGRKGTQLYKMGKAHLDDAYATLTKSFELQKEKSEANPLYYLFLSEYKLFKRGDKTKQDVIDFYPKISDVIQKALSDPNKSEKSKSAYTQVSEQVDKYFSKVATCDDIIEIYTKKFNENSTDTELLKTITSTLEKSKCTESSLFFKAASKLHEQNPSAESAYALGVNQKDNCDKAAPLFKQAAELSSDNAFKEKAYLNAAKCYLASRKYSNARKFAREVLAINPNSGAAYMVIGNAYASGASSCGDNACEKKAGYWAAVDKFQKAKAVDASVASKAQQSINKFSGYFPGKEDCFFYNITEGSSYTVKGWIGETTTARFFK